MVEKAVTWCEIMVVMDLLGCICEKALVLLKNIGW